MRYGIRIALTDHDEAYELRRILSDIVDHKVELVKISGAEEYARLDVRSWPLANYILSRMDPSRSYFKDDLALFAEEMGWSANSISTVLVKLCAAGVLRKIGTGLYRKEPK